MYPLPTPWSFGYPLTLGLYLSTALQPCLDTPILKRQHSLLFSQRKNCLHLHLTPCPPPFFLPQIVLNSISHFPGGTSGKEFTCQCRRSRFDPWAGKIPWRRAWQPTPVFLPGESQGQRTLVDYSPYRCRVRHD